MPFKDKAAQKAWSEKYYQENREEIILQKRQHYQENKEEMNAERRESYQDPEVKKKKQDINKKSRIKNSETISKKRRTPKLRFQFLTSYAKKRELSCTLTQDQYAKLIEPPCFYCENQLGTTVDATGVGLDRIDNNRGYELENVVSCCVVCNRMRGDHFTPEETKVAAQAVIEFRKSSKKEDG